MSPSLVLEFTKMHGAGNDFLVLDNRWYRFSDEELADLAASWCRRRFGVGADGLLALAEPEAADAAYRMRYVNADGSWATMCGNGARCLARFAMNADFEGPEVAFETDAGRYHAALVEDEPDLVRLYVPPATNVEIDVELKEPVPFSSTAVHYVHTGTGHLVVFVSDLESVPVAEWAPPLRNDPRVEPPGANVNFVEVGDNTLSVRTYEKGVEGETLSCGTGVLAAAEVAEVTNKVSGDPVTVETEGGGLPDRNDHDGPRRGTVPGGACRHGISRHAQRDVTERRFHRGQRGEFSSRHRDRQGRAKCPYMFSDACQP